ncbi:MAG: hypothetical protein IPM47_14950 [Sphingobacteriales bacterium]|nr:MAG: hypothetical protein IPM47_14950 [Sphingobacteriales bacterium]
MATEYYLPNSDDGRNGWLNNFNTKLPEHATALEIDAPTLAYVNNATLVIDYVLTLERALKANSSEWTAYKRVHIRGKAGEPVSGIPTLVTLGTPPTAPTEPVMARIIKLVQIIKNHPNYTESIGRDLKVIGPDSTVTDTTNWQPKLKAVLNAGKVLLKFTKGKAESTDFYVDRGHGLGYVKMDYTVTSSFEDPITLPVGSAPEIWTYRAVFRYGGVQVGMLSLPVSIVVVPFI